MGRRTILRSAQRVAMFALAIGLVAGAWELYRWLGPEKGGKLFGWTVLPKSKRTVMPGVFDILGRLDDPLGRSGESIWWFLTKSAWYTLQLALLGFVIGTLLGVVLAVVMSRLRMFERALMPYLVISQTVPLIALAPLVAGWGGKLSVFGWEWQRWTSVMAMGVFLSFFPVALGTLRGLRSAPAAALELMDSFAAPWRVTLWKLRFPAAVPHMVPAMKIGAAGAVIGVIVGEISVGLRGGVGRPIIEFAKQNSNDPSKVYAAILAAAVVGLVMAMLVGAFDAFLMRRRPKEATL